MPTIKTIVLLINALFTACLLLSAPHTDAQTTQVLDNAKIIQLVKMRLTEDLIIAKIRKSGCTCDTSVDAIAELKAAKVSDTAVCPRSGFFASFARDGRPAAAAGKFWPLGGRI